MGPTLNTASGMNAYALTDRGTWLSFKNRGELAILVQGDQRLFNQYGVMLVNPAKHPHVKKADGMAFINWLTSAEGPKAIADYKIDGEQLFFPEGIAPPAVMLALRQALPDGAHMSELLRIHGPRRSSAKSAGTPSSSPTISSVTTATSLGPTARSPGARRR